MRFQTGEVSFLGLLGVMAGGLVLWVAIAVSPAFIEHHQVKLLVEEARADAQLAKADKSKVYLWFSRAFKNNNLWELEPRDIIQITGTGSKRQIVLQYEVRKPLFSNVELLMDFSDES